MNWAGVLSLLLFLLMLTTTWWWVEGYLPNLGGFFKYNGNPITFVWSSGNASSLGLSLEAFKWLSEGGRLPPGVAYRTGITKFFLTLCTALLFLALLLSVYALLRKSSRAYFTASALVFLSFILFEFAFLATEAPKAAVLTFDVNGEQGYVKWGEGVGKYLAILLSGTLLASGFINNYLYERPLTPKRRPRRARSYW
ncbi:MAG: hypothetical protein NZ992_07405 [Candidatus Korarchaeum sp.]|nr:hypothetical protein [Candidatus Korarchaeum sp.]MDW8035093.1 hypothetical protein [Candidatus Korarchaeum sp.]